MHEFDFYHAPEEQMEDEAVEEVELEVQAEGKHPGGNFEGRRLSHSKSNKNLIDSSGGGGVEDDSMVSGGDHRAGTYP